MKEWRGDGNGIEKELQISDDEKMKRFEKKFEVMWLEYEKDIAPILEKKNEIEKENDQVRLILLFLLICSCLIIFN